jgi:phytoene dehydrogenase-like protein
MSRELAVLGAGVAGLVAGIYAARSGFEVTVYEMGDVPGGLCTSWRRKGFLFDGSSAGLAGTSPEAPIWRLWKDCGVIDRCELLNPTNFGEILLPSGRRARIHTDIDALEGELLGLFPGDRGAIGAFIRGLRACRGLDIPFDRAGEAGSGNRGKALPLVAALPAALKFGGTTLRRFIGGLADPECRLAFSHMVHFGGLDVPMLTIMLPLAYAHRKMTGIPRGGWLSFARSMEAELVSLGGRIEYRRKAVALSREGGAWGLRFEDGSRAEAGRLLCAIDGRYAQERLLAPLGLRALVDFREAGVSDQPVQVSIGAALDPASFDGAVTVLAEGVEIVAGRRQEALTFHVNCFNPEAAPPGKASIIAFVDSGYHFWKALGSEAYEAEKARCGAWAVGMIGRAVPGFASRVELVDVATPLTRERYTGNWLGAMQARKPDQSMLKSLLGRSVRYSHPGAKGLYLAGHWVEAWGGITTAAQSGRNAVRALCRDDGIPFCGAG